MHMRWHLFFISLLGLITTIACNCGPQTQKKVEQQLNQTHQGSQAGESDHSNNHGPQTLNLTVTGMTCDACKNAVLQALKTTAGVESAEVSLPNSAVVTYDPKKTTPELIKKAILDTGFGVQE